MAPVVRDLVIDTEKAYERVNRVKPYIISPKPPRTDGKEQVVSPKALERYVSAARCINCFCCASACIGGHGNFLGPNAMLAAIVRVMDSREQEKQERRRCMKGFIDVTRPGPVRLYIQKRSMLRISSRLPRLERWGSE